MQIISENKTEQKLAKTPHEIFTINAALVHLFLPTAMLKFGDPRFAITLPIFLSIGVIIWTYFRTKKSYQTGSLLVKIHWQLSLNRYKLLIGAYIFYFLVNGFSILFFSDAIKGMNGQSVMEDVFLILAVVPLFIMVFLSVVLGSGSIFNAGRGEVPIKLFWKFQN